MHGSLLEEFTSIYAWTLPRVTRYRSDPPQADKPIFRPKPAIPFPWTLIAMLLSIVSPMYNETEGIAEFVRQIHAALDPFSVGWEMILVNDGSKDDSLEKARAIATADPRIRVVSFSRNFGHEAASSAGFRYAAARPWSSLILICRTPLP